jgi:predicted ATP-dependent endonuclease of OLD family
MAKIKSIKFKGYKSFKSQNTITLGENFTLFIGKNNCGKSSTVDIIEAVYNLGKQLEIKNEIEKLAVSFEIEENYISYGFSKSMSGGDISGNHYAYGKQFIGKEVFFSSNITNRDRELKFEQNQENIGNSGKNQWDRVAQMYSRYGHCVAIRRINAERDIVPEVEKDNVKVSENGSGATNLVRIFVNNSMYDEKLVEVELLSELNKIMMPDTEFENIKIQQIKAGEEWQWEIFLTEKNGGRFALSKSGSGLKTILLVLINLYLIPNLNDYKEKNMLFVFEELENNLHPALQRRLFDYLFDYSTRTGKKVVLTSHSHVAINCLFGKTNSKLYHVIKNDESNIVEIANYIDKVEILEDLDVKASDLLQSNGIIWVEGPSDRVYIKKWLDIFCECKYQEGRDYQFLYYGGRLLSHYTAEDEGIDNLINILFTNRNAAIVIDSDKKSPHSRINETKKRIQKEFQNRNMFCWITKGKEIENYISTESLMIKYKSILKKLEPYDIFPEYIKSEDKNFTSHKVDFARKICECITYDNSQNILDLKSKVNELYKMIQKWNKI